MALYERLMGWTDLEDKLPVHQFTATLREFGRSRLTGAQAQAVVSAIGGAPLTAGEITEAQTLLATVTAAGNATARLARVVEIDDVLLLAERRAPGYDTPALIRTRLGV